MTLPSPENLMFPPVTADGHEAVGDGRSLTADVVIVGTGPGGAAGPAAILENNLQEDGRVKVPDCLQYWMQQEFVGLAE